MMRKFYYLFIVLFIQLFPVFIHVGHAQDVAVISGDFPDPTVIAADGKYYAIGTSSEWGPHFPIYESTDLMDWKQTGFVFSYPPEWTSSSFWAPEYFYHNGLYYVYYSAKRKSDGVSCIGVATSRYPDRDFVDHGIVVDYGSESIDAYVIKEGDELYMTWKAYGLDDRPIELLGSRLSSDGFRLEGEPFSLLLDTARVGIEGQSFVKKNGYYYMFYSAGACCGIHCDYHVQAVRARSIRGPYERVGGDMLLGENAEWKCMGHGTFVKGKNRQLYYLFHGYNKNGTSYTGREGLLAELTWISDEIPNFVFIPAPMEKGLQNIHVDFKNLPQDKLFWQWDYRYVLPKKTYTAYGLELSEQSMREDNSSVALTLRPHSVDYIVGAIVDLQRSSEMAEKGVVVYGDHDQSIGVDVKENRIRFWSVHNGGKIVLKEENCPIGQQYAELRLSINPQRLFRAFYKRGEDWVELLPADKNPQSESISPWDRSPRPGLHFSGTERDKAIFTHFYLIHQP